MTVRIGGDWLGLPSRDVTSLHWLGALEVHHDPLTSRAYLRRDDCLVPLLDLLPLTGAVRPSAPEFALLVRNSSVGVEPPAAGLLVEEFGEVLTMATAPVAIPALHTWWQPLLHDMRLALRIPHRGMVPVVSTAALIASSVPWPDPGATR
ncbi:MAG: hypothetical protein H6835_13380 [Planctomycetes bacterium]|nr:hypothetical protein [Planctomycetota bacterium]